MFTVSLTEHVGDIKKIMLDVHPIVGRGPWHIGYCDPVRSSWSLLHTHGLSEDQATEVDRQLENLIHAHVGANTSG